MTRQLAYLVSVPDARSGDTARRRVAGLLPDGETIAVAILAGAAETATAELEFRLGDALALAEACLSGNARALTTPGLTRKLSATVAILFRVAVERGAVIEPGDADGPDLFDDRPEAAPDEDPDD